MNRPGDRGPFNLSRNFRTARSTSLPSDRGYGLATGVGTAAGVGASVAAAVGAATGTSTVLGASSGGSAAIGAATGTSTVSGVGASRVAAVGAAAGTSTVSGVGSTGASSSGTVAITEALDAIAAAGTVNPVTGTAALTETKDAVTAAGTVAYPGLTGTASYTEQADVIAAAGAVLVAGTAALVQSKNLIAGADVLHAVANQPMLGPVPVATVALIGKAAAAQQIPAIGQFYLIGAMSVSGNQTLPPFDQAARAANSVPPVTHWLVQYSTIDFFSQSATVTAARTVASNSTFAFTQTATALHVGVGAVSSVTLPGFFQVATLTTTNKLVAAQSFPAFSTAATAKAIDKLAGAQTLPGFGQVAVIPGYAAFVANKRTFTPNPQVRTDVVHAEVRTITFKP